MATLKVTRQAAVKLLKGLGHVNADKLPVPALQNALRKIDDTYDDAAQARVTSADSVELLKKVILSLARADDVVVTDGKLPASNGHRDRPARDEPRPATKPAPPAVINTKTTPDARPKQGGPTPAKKTAPPSKPAAPPAAARPPKGPGPSRDAGVALAKRGRPRRVDPTRRLAISEPSQGKPGKPTIGYLVYHCLLNASAKEPVRPDAICDFVLDKRKDKRETEGGPEGVMVTVRDLLNRTFEERYGITVSGDRHRGYWIDGPGRKA